MKSLLPGHSMPNLIQLVQGTEQVLPTASVGKSVCLLVWSFNHAFSYMKSNRQLVSQFVDRTRRCGRGHGLSGRSSPSRATQRTEFNTSRAASKETMPSRGCCGERAWRNSPSRRDEVLIRRLGTTQGCLCCATILYNDARQKTTTIARRAPSLRAGVTRFPHSPDRNRLVFHARHMHDAAGPRLVDFALVIVRGYHITTLGGSR
jgi:hypothetical protein